MNRALILDFGGVISRTLFETHSLSEQALGLPKGSLSWRGPFAPESDPMWVSMQNGVITERAYWQNRTLEVAALVGENWSRMSDFVRAARGADPDAVVRPEARLAVSRAKAAGCKLAILSNELDLFYGAEFRDKLPFLADFDVITDATYTHILKPDPEAYQGCLKALDIPAECAVFVDDQARNINGARKVGLNTVHFNVRNPSAGYNDALRQLGIGD